jgi:Ni,Fe-hydrogenase III small subunit
MAEGGQQVAVLERFNTYLVTNPKDVQVMFMKSGQITNAVFKQASRKYLSKLRM